MLVHSVLEYKTQNSRQKRAASADSVLIKSLVMLCQRIRNVVSEIQASTARSGSSARRSVYRKVYPQHNTHHVGNRHSCTPSMCRSRRSKLPPPRPNNTLTHVAAICMQSRRDNTATQQLSSRLRQPIYVCHPSSFRQSLRSVILSRSSTSTLHCTHQSRRWIFTREQQKKELSAFEKAVVERVR